MSSNKSIINRLLYTLIISIYVAGLFFLLLHVAHYTEKTDFPVFYSTAKTVLKKGIFNDAIYLIDHDNQYRIPEKTGDLVFIYSKVAALIISPLGFLPYYYAKSVMILLNILAYLWGTFLVLRILGFSGRLEIFTWGISFFWLPFIQVIRFGQIDGLLFFFIAGALWFAEKRRPFPAGAMIGIAMLFKISPLALGLVLALRNYKILLSCLIVFGSSLLIPGAMQWFKAIPGIYPRAFSLIYLTLKSHNIWLYVFYCLLVGGATAYLVHKKEDIDYIQIFAITIPAIYLTMPIVEYYHLTMLIISVFYIFSKTKSFLTYDFAALILSIAAISIAIIVEFSNAVFIGLFLLWITMLYKTALNRGGLILRKMS